MGNKIWTENEITWLLMTNDKFIIKCLCKLKELDLIYLNDFANSVYEYYMFKLSITKKQIEVLRKCFTGDIEIGIFTKIANKQEITFDDLNKRCFDLDDHYDSSYQGYIDSDEYLQNYRRK